MNAQGTERPSAPAARVGGAMKKTLVVLGAVVGVFVLVVGVFGPAIASSVAPGIIERGVNEQIQGSASVSGVHLSWGGPLRVDSISLRDPGGREVIKAKASVDAGLWRVITGNLDLGAIRVKAD
ncbi:MAG TPA: hypothetical protein VG797_07715, partial [Phycisphaerales bacterium]|nr:hypothetical protein [Phycisphaerales bacterium]